MNGNRFAFMFSTILANPSVSIYSLQARLFPIPASISFRAAYPKRGLFIPRHFGVIAIMAAITRFAILTHKPRFYTKRFTAMFAGILNRFNPFGVIFPSYLFADKRISWAQSFTYFVSLLETIPHVRALRLMPLTRTLKTTKSCCILPVWLYLKRLTAYLASHINHKEIIPQIIDIGTIGIAEKRIKEAQMQLRLGI